MQPTAIPTRITIDFRDAIHPSRTWILGLGDPSVARVELITFDRPTASGAATALTADCTCPDGCERDHANE